MTNVKSRWPPQPLRRRRSCSTIWPLNGNRPWAPCCTAQTTEGEVDFHGWLGDSWGVLFSHPADYTPVCTTELGTVAKIKAEFTKRNVKFLAISVDPLDQGWIKDINETQACTVN